MLALKLSPKNPYTLLNKTLVADLEEVFADESYDFDNIVPINYHEPELIRRFFEFKVIRYRKILSENNFS